MTRSFLLLTVLAACNNGSDDLDDTDVLESGLALFGNSAHDPSLLSVTTVADSGDELDDPTDVAVHPDGHEVWVIQKDDESMVIIDLDGGSDHVRGSSHFMAQPMGLAFSVDGDTMATIHETDELTQGAATPEDFMGPTMWPADSDDFDADHASHLDMLHNSPNGVGIASEGDNVYWVFDGYHDALTRYDFADDHGAGGADHSDGLVERWVEGEVDRVPDVPSNLVFDQGHLYVADSGNGRIAVLDTNTGTGGGNVGPNYDGTDQTYVEDAVLTTLVDTADGIPLNTPSGLALHDNVLYVGDQATGKLYAYDLAGTLLDWVPLDVGELAGIDVDAEGNLYYLDRGASTLYRIEAP